MVRIYIGLGLLLGLAVEGWLVAIRSLSLWLSGAVIVAAALLIFAFAVDQEKRIVP